MHQLLYPIWKEVYRVLRPGGFACINIGDATRTIDKRFKLYANHARILRHCLEIGKRINSIRQLATAQTNTNSK